MAYYQRTHKGHRGRSNVLLVARAQSNDFLNWTQEKVAVKPDDIDRAGSPDGLTRMDFYGGNISRYREAQDVQIGLPNAYYHWKFDLARK